MNTLSPVGVPGFEPTPRPYPLSAARGPIAAPRGLPRSASRTMPPLAIGRIAKEATLITLLLLLNIFGNVGAAIFFTILLVMSFTSSSAAFKALVIMWLGLMLNHGLVPKSLTWTPSRLILPYACLARFSFDMVSMRASLFTQPFYVIFLVYCLVMALCSFMSGWFTSIALIKLINFWAAFSSVFAGAFVLVRKRVDIGEWLVSMIVAATAIAFLAIASGRAYISFGHGSSNHFGGAFLHPNCHSSYASLFCIMLVAVYAFSPYRQRWLVLPLLAIWAVFIAWSKSRTAVVATGIGVLSMAPFVVSAVRPAGWIRRVNIRRSTLVAMAAVAGVTILVADIASGNRISTAVVAFVNKSGPLDDLGEVSLDMNSVIYSRVTRISDSMENFRENPVFGIGFQVAKTEWFARNATIFTAPVEKGFLPSAVLEEGGVLGAVAFLIFIVSLPMTFLVRGNIPAFGAFCSFIGSSMTEVSLFSPGGSGGFGWVMVAAAFVFGEMCWVKKQGHAPLPGRSPRDTARPALARVPHPLPGIATAG